MAFRVASSSDYAKLQKTANKNVEGVSQWEQFFLQPLQESFEAAEKQISAQTSYDISGAYANYKKQQLNLLQNQALGTGFKEQAGAGLLSQYQTAFGEAKAEETSNLTTLAQQYQKTLAEEESRLLKRGQQFADIEKAIYDFRGVDMSKLEDLGYYENIDGVYQLTEAGKDLIDETLNLGIVSDDGKTVSRFSDYIYETQPELYDFYSQNIGDIRELVGGLSRSDETYSPKERAYAIEANKYKQEIADKLKNVESEHVKNLYSNLKTDFESDEEAKNYYKEIANKLENSPEYIGSVDDVMTGSPDLGSTLTGILTSGIDDMLTLNPVDLLNASSEQINKAIKALSTNATRTVGGKTYDVQHVIEPSSSRSAEITKDLDIYNKLKKGILKIGDVIEHNGSMLVIEGNTGNKVVYTQLNTIEEANDVMKSRGYVRKRDPWTDKWKWVKQ